MPTTRNFGKGKRQARVPITRSNRPPVVSQHAAELRGCRSRYGMSMDDYASLVARQGGVCAICERQPAERLCVDHSHATGKVRGLPAEMRIRRAALTC